MKVLYFDCFSGAAGDMILGALIDAGVPLDEVRRALGSLAIEPEAVWTERVSRAGVSATKFCVRGEDPSTSLGASPSTAPGAAVHGTSHPHRHLKGIYRLIDGSALSDSGKARAKALFERLGAAEAAIHGTTMEKVHLHEVGALDSIIDIVGTVFALEWLGADTIVSSPLNVGGGMVTVAHGVYPVPAPATMRLLEGTPIYAGEQKSELVTPTGALIVSSYAREYGPVPPMTVSSIGYGAGSRDFNGTPNVLRVLVGESVAMTPRLGSGQAEVIALRPPIALRPQGSAETRSPIPDPRFPIPDSRSPIPDPRSVASPNGDAIVVIECEIDDMNPQIFGVLMDRLLAEGALDVFYTSVQMKKNRPGTLLTILSPPARRERLTALVFTETTSIGVRYREMTRECLERETVTVETPLGPARLKVGRRGPDVMNVSPEFDDCVRIAENHGKPVKEVQALVMNTYLQTRPG